MRIFVLGICLLLAMTAVSVAKTSEVEYYAILMEGSKIGHVQHTRTIEGDRVTTAEDMTMTIARGSMSITITTIETSIETTRGKPIGFEVIQNISGMNTKMTGKIAKGEAKVKIEAMGTSQDRTVKYPDDALMAEGIRLLQLEKGIKEGTAYEAVVFSPSILMCINATVSVGKEAEIDMFGRVTKLTEVTTAMNLPTGTINSISYVDSEYRAQKTILPTMGMNLEIIACDREFALSKNDVVDFLDRLLIESPVAIGDAKGKTSAVYTLSPIGNAKLEIPSHNSQIVKKLADGKFTVEVKPIAAKKGVKFPYKGKDAEIVKSLESTQYLQSDNEAVVKLAKDAVGDSTDAAEAAGKIESFVAGYINEKDLSVGYASAMEVAASRQGDCTEHAVLMAAMCRAVGIPSRVVFGLVYAEEFLGKKDIFGGHAWTQAYIGDKWINFDATRAPGGYSVGHIILATGSGDPGDFFGMVNTLGYFKIDKAVIK